MNVLSLHHLAMNSKLRKGKLRKLRRAKSFLYHFWTKTCVSGHRLSVMYTVVNSPVMYVLHIKNPQTLGLLACMASCHWLIAQNREPSIQPLLHICIPGNLSDAL